MKRKENIAVARKNSRWAVYWRRYFWLYLFLIPGVTIMILFKYLPIYGLQIAFKDYSIIKGIWGSEWNDFKHFKDLFRSVNFSRVFKNSLWLSFLNLMWGFPVPILLALALNEMRNIRFKRVMQTVMYLPHFLSWVIVSTLLVGLLSQSTGVINSLIEMCGGEKIAFLTSPKWFRTVYVGSGVWKEAGWGTIVYLAALAGIDESLYEAASIDGANRWQKMRYITFPCIRSTVSVMLILRMGSILSNDFERIWLLQNSINREVAEVLETYSYQVGLREGRLDFATAIGLFKSAVNLVLVYFTNYVSKKMGGDGLW